jgi:hypothetical protein
MKYARMALSQEDMFYAAKDKFDNTLQGNMRRRSSVVLAKELMALLGQGRGT